MSDSSIAKGEIFTARWMIDEGLASTFERCSGDVNPIHADDAYARAQGYKARLMPGAMLHAFLSGFVGTGLPVKDTLCLMQKLSYRAPFFIGDEIRLEAMVTNLQPAPFQDDKEVVEFGVLFKRDAEIVASGTLQVLVGKK